MKLDGFVQKTIRIKSERWIEIIEFAKQFSFKTENELFDLMFKLAMEYHYTGKEVPSISPNKDIEPFKKNTVSEGFKPKKETIKIFDDDESNKF